MAQAPGLWKPGQGKGPWALSISLQIRFVHGHFGCSHSGVRVHTRTPFVFIISFLIKIVL